MKYAPKENKSNQFQEINTDEIPARENNQEQTPEPRREDITEL